MTITPHRLYRDHATGRVVEVVSFAGGVVCYRGFGVYESTGEAQFSEEFGPVEEGAEEC